MIDIEIKVRNEKVYDSFKHKESTLQENAMVLRRLEEIKKLLLDIEYKEELLIEEDAD